MKENLSNAPVMPTDDQLYAEVARLREVNDDLRASALWWKQLYETAMVRRRDADAALFREDSRLEWLGSGDSGRHPS